MSASRRSTTGCSMCKGRRKKCDETKPQCLRCSASGRPCTYEYVEHPENGSHRVKRTKPLPRTNPTSARSLVTNPSSSASPIPGDSTALSRSVPPKRWSNETYPNSDLDVPPIAGSLLPYTPTFPLTPQSIVDIDPTNSSIILPGLGGLPADILHEYDATLVTPGLTSQELVSLDTDEDAEDPEKIGFFLSIAPTMDANVKDNALPFALQCYSQWAIASVFEPLRVAHTMREHVITQFSSESTRTRTMLIANVMRMFAKQLTIDHTRKSMLNRLTYEAQKSGSSFMSTPFHLTPSQDRQNAMRTLDAMLEIFSLQTTTQPIAACIQSLDHAAPVFRRACSEPLGQPVNLLNVLLSDNFNLRHFATVDIIKSVTTGLPTYFQFEVPFSLELCEQMYQLRGSCGLQWLHGYPDQLILLLAWINSLCYTPGASVDPKLVAWIETNLPRIKLAIDESGDPTLRIARMVVQECWRFVVLIYLYMGLCKVDAGDYRVRCAQKGFMRLVRGIRPARNPDAYLFRAMIIAGVATIDEQDRDTLRERILNVRECAERGTVGNDIMLELEDIWARTRNEGRTAIWSDLRIANSKLTGR